MSEVISFRLNPENQREARAYQVLHDWVAKGYSLRYVMTEALLSLENRKDVTQALASQEIEQIFDQLQQIRDSLDTGKSSDVIAPDEKAPEPGLSDAFIASIRKGVKAGIRS